MIPWWGVGKDHIHFKYELGGGSIMGMGTYNFAAMRLIFGAEPEECVEVETQTFPEEVHHDCDHTFSAKFRFPGGRIGEAKSTLQGPMIWTPSYAKATHKKVVVDDTSLPEDQEKTVVREVTIHGFIHAIFWHRIDIKESLEIRNKSDGKVVKRWVENTWRKAYSFKDAGGDFANVPEPGEDHWMSFRHQLKEFVNKVKGRPTRTWVSGQDSIDQMKMVDMAYEKSGLGIRPTSSFK